MSNKSRRYNRNVHYIADWIILQDVIGAPDFNKRPKDEQRRLLHIDRRLRTFVTKNVYINFEAKLLRYAYVTGQLTPDEWEMVKSRRAGSPTVKWMRWINDLCLRVTGVDHRSGGDAMRLRIVDWCKAKLAGESVPPLKPTQHTARQAERPQKPQQADVDEMSREERMAAAIDIMVRALVSSLKKRNPELDPEPEEDNPEMVDAEDQDRIDAIAGELLDEIDWGDDEEA